MGERILMVDDDVQVTRMYQRALRGSYPDLTIANSAVDGLQLIESEPPYSVVITDMEMPGMDGVELLSRVRTLAPRTVCMMMTGHPDLRVAMDAVRAGHIFRFLIKPCPADQVAEALKAGIEQHRLIMAEVELLEKTLNGSLKILSDILTLVDPRSFGLTAHVRSAASTLAQAIDMPNVWEVETAATLARIGIVSVPPSVLARTQTAQSLPTAERTMMARVPEVGSSLLRNLPRMENVASIVLYQNKHFDGKGTPADTVAGEAIPYGARVLKLVSDMVALEAKGQSRTAALATLARRPGWYDPALLVSAIATFRAPSAPPKTIHVTLPELRPGQVLVQNLLARDGRVLLAAGTQITDMLLVLVNNFGASHGVREPIEVRP